MRAEGGNGSAIASKARSARTSMMRWGWPASRPQLGRWRTSLHCQRARCGPSTKGIWKCRDQKNFRILRALLFSCPSSYLRSRSTPESVQPEARRTVGKTSVLEPPIGFLLSESNSQVIENIENGGKSKVQQRVNKLTFMRRRIHTDTPSSSADMIGREEAVRSDREAAGVAVDRSYGLG